MTIKAKPIIKNKLWVIEDEGTQVGTILAVPDGVVLVQGPNREKYPSLKLLASKHNIKISPPATKKHKNENNVHGFPCNTNPYNPIYDIKLKLPLYTTDEKSKSFYCAGYYLINIEGEWVSTYCPKKIVLSRHEFFGPFMSKEISINFMKQIPS